MSFKVNWNSLESDSLQSWTTELLTDALNSGKRPNILASDITIKDLNFGKVAPLFEILEIGELGRDRFRGIFKIDYSGDFHLTLHTKVQANPLKIYSENSLEREVLATSPFVTPDFLLSVDPFNIPLDLKLSDIKISGIGIIVFSKSKGLTMVFRNDPLDSIKVSSTFDTVQVLAKFLQKQIENQVRDLFRETLPTLIHKFSLKYTSSYSTNEIIHNLKNHLNSNSHANSQETLEVENVSSANLQKLAQIYTSRETLKLNVPKLKKIVQRNHLEKFNKNLYPNLANSLYANMGLQGLAPTSSNSIPVELVANQDFKKVNEILREISDIQSKSFKSSNSDHKPAKRRTIKMGSKAKKGVAQQALQKTVTPLDSPMDTPLMSKSVSESTDILSDGSTVHSDTDHSQFEHPIPLKGDLGTRPPLQPNYVVSSQGGLSSGSPMNSNSSFVGGVGLGNNFFQIANGRGLSASPLRKELSGHDIKLKVKKSMNRIDVNQINEKLRDLDQKLRGVSTFELGRDRQPALDQKLAGGMDTTSFDLPPPPPYHQLPRV